MHFEINNELLANEDSSIEMSQPENNMSQGKSPNSEITNCIFDTSKICGHLHRLKASSIPKVYVISSTEFKNVVSWFKEVLKGHIRTEQDSKFEIVYFADLPTFDFCNNVCIPIYESWFCIAIIKEELLPQFVRRKNKNVVTSFINRLNPNVFFEVGLALAWKKGIIFYVGNDQELPSDWINLAQLIIIEPSLFLSSEDPLSLMNKLRDIIKLNPFIGYPVKWVETENE